MVEDLPVPGGPWTRHTRARSWCWTQAWLTDTMISFWTELSLAMAGIVAMLAWRLDPMFLTLISSLLGEMRLENNLDWDNSSMAENFLSSGLILDNILILIGLSVDS